MKNFFEQFDTWADVENEFKKYPEFKSKCLHSSLQEQQIYISLHDPTPYEVDRKYRKAILFSRFNYEEESRFFISTMERKYGRITENVIDRMYEFMEQKKNGILFFVEVDHTLVRRDARTITIYAKKNDACFSLITLDHRMTAAYWWGVWSGNEENAYILSRWSILSYLDIHRHSGFCKDIIF